MGSRTGKMIFSTLLILLLLGGAVLAVEEAPYAIIDQEGQIELRSYDSYVLAETKISGDMESAGSQAFRLLFDFIAGGNSSQSKVDMTAPVSQMETSGEKISMTAPVSQEAAGD